MPATQAIRRNWPQFAFQLLTVFAVGLTIGAERNVVLALRMGLDIGSMLVVGQPSGDSIALYAQNS